LLDFIIFAKESEKIKLFTFSKKYTNIEMPEKMAFLFSKYIRGSSNGRTAGFGPVNRGSPHHPMWRPVG